MTPLSTMTELAHWDCWGWCGNRTVSRPEANSTPEWAMDLLLEKVRLVFGEQDWSTWEWSAREPHPRAAGHRWVCGLHHVPGDQPLRPDDGADHPVGSRHLRAW